MSCTDDLIAALECRQPLGVVPVWELEFHLWGAFSGRHVVLGREFERLSAAGQEKALRTNAEIILSVSSDLGFAAVSGPGGFWQIAPGHLAYYVLPANARFRQIEILSGLAGKDMGVFGGANGTIMADYSEAFCVALFERPEEIDALTQKTLEEGIAAARRLRDGGATAVVNAADIADNSGPFFKPAQMERFILPYLNAWAESCKTMGLYTILHTDGRLPPPYIEMLAETAVDALQAIDPVAGMDMAATKQLARGRLCLCGNIDCGLLVTGRPEQVFEATRRLLEECKGGGGLVLGASNAVQCEVPVENYRAMNEAWKSYGAY
jgi:uroporphyrinogen decarboxylase